MGELRCWSWNYKFGAVDWDRTSDLLVTSELLYQLSYNGDSNFS